MSSGHDFSGADGSLSGRQIGRYLIGERLGSGGVATVYRAYDQVESVDVALKILPSTADADALLRFRREALTAGGLRHPNIVRTLQVGTPAQGELAYIAMDLVAGSNLGDLLGSRGRLRPDESAQLLQPIATALAFAHGQGVVHRDVKPANILLKPVPPETAGAVRIDGLETTVVPMLTDFGVALALDSPELTGQGHTVGTPAYMAPEQCAGSRQIDGRADIYALGVVLYRCVVGQLPYSGTTTQILYAHVYEPLRIPDSILRQLPPVVVDIFRQSMAKPPDDRYPTADAMARDLALVAGVPRHDAPPQAPPGDAETPTSTMTMATLPAQPAPSSTAGSSVIVPAPSGRTEPTPPGPSPALRTAPPTQPRPSSRRRVNWLGIAALVAAMLTGLALAALVVRLGLWPPAGSPPPPAEPAVLPVAVATATPTLSEAAARFVRTPTADADGEPDDVALSETAESTAPVATPVPTELPTEPPTSTPLATLPPTPEPQITNCSAIVDPFFAPYINGLQTDLASLFRCPTGEAGEGGGAFLRFERGFMLRLDNDPRVLIYYDLNQEWEQAVPSWQAGDPPLTGDFPPPGPGLHQPEQAFGQLWAEPQRQAALGFATQEQPEQFPAVSQSFLGGALVGNRATNGVYLFLRDKLRL